MRPEATIKDNKVYSELWVKVCGAAIIGVFSFGFAWAVGMEKRQNQDDVDKAVINQKLDYIVKSVDKINVAIDHK